MSFIQIQRRCIPVLNHITSIHTHTHKHSLTDIRIMLKRICRREGRTRLLSALPLCSAPLHGARERGTREEVGPARDLPPENREARI